MIDHIQEQFAAARQVLSAMSEDQALQQNLQQAAQLCIDCLRRRGKILLIGNGGSAADCQHIAGEFVSRFMFDRPGLPAIALTTDSSIMTAIGNDYGYEKLFQRQLQALAQPGDVLIAYSTSGRSPNIVLALEEARRLDVQTIGMSGNRGGPMHALCDIMLCTPSASTPRIQEGHLVLGHTLCSLVERAMFGEAG